MASPKPSSVWYQAMLLPMIVIFGFLVSVGACGPGNVTPDGGAKDSGPSTDKKAEETTTPDKAKDGGPTDNGTNEKKPQETPPEQPAGGITATAVGKDLRAPFDAAPGPDGKTVYYTATKKADADDPEGFKGLGTLYKVPATGGTPTELATGYHSPLGLIVSSDGTQIFVADHGAIKSEDDESNGKDDSGVYVVSSTGGTPAIVTGTTGYRPKGLDIVKESGDLLYFTGTDPSDGKAGVFRVDAKGGTVAVVAKGEPLMDPSGIAVHSNGDVYVANTISGESGQSGVYKISNGKIEAFVTPLRVGYPAGIALNKDGTHLFVSGLQAQQASAVVYQIELTSKTVKELSDGISQNSESGGVHRAHNKDVFAWSNCDAPDENGNGGGTVYLITPK